MRPFQRFITVAAAIRSLRFLPLLALTIACGCGGSGTSSGGTGGTGGTSTIAIVPATTPAQTTAEAPTLGLTLHYTGSTPVDHYKWNIMAMGPSPVWGLGTITDSNGNSLIGVNSTLTQVTYNNRSSGLYFGMDDEVSVIAFDSTGKQLATAKLDVVLSSDYVTLPAPITTAEINISLDKPLYAPGSVVTQTMNVLPGLNNTVFTLDAPIGFTPTAVTVNGSAVTLPYTQTYLAQTAPFTVVVKYTLPAVIGNEFPTVVSARDFNGPWITGSGGGGSGAFVFYNPFFIHS